MNFKTIAAFIGLAACGAPTADDAVQLPTIAAASLPAPHSNNAVAAAVRGDEATFYSFYGLRAGKTGADVSMDVFACSMPEGVCSPIASPPVEQGRLGAVAVFLYDRIFLFGGYTAADDGSEVSMSDVYSFNPETEEYARRTDMPVPVDDAVAFHYANRYIYLVSGWHDDGNVSLVQVFDTWEDKWFQASDYPGAPVFGHAGGAVGGKLVIADGVAVVGEENGKRIFAAVDEIWLGEIDAGDPAAINWRRQPPHPGGPLYRMAATGDPTRGRIVFFGGADNPYNYNAIGYDGVPAKASSLLFAFDLETEQWIDLGRADRSSMDHRGLMIWDNAYWTLGGMNNDGEVTGDLVRISNAE